MEIYKTKAASITYHSDQNYIKQTIHDFLPSQELTELQASLLKLCKTKTTDKIIADCANLKAVKPEDIKWMINAVLPQLTYCGIKYFAIVIPDNPFGQLAVKLFVEANSNIKMKIFNDLPTAQNWIYSEN